MSNGLMAFTQGFLDRANTVNAQQKQQEQENQQWLERQQMAVSLDNVKQAATEAREARKLATQADTVGTGYDTRYGTDVGLQVRQAIISNPKLLDDPEQLDRVAQQYVKMGVKSTPAQDSTQTQAPGSTPTMPGATPTSPAAASSAASSTEFGGFSSAADQKMGTALGMDPDAYSKAQSGNYIPPQKKFVQNYVQPNYADIEDQKKQRASDLILERIAAQYRFKKQFATGGKMSPAQQDQYYTDEALKAYVDEANKLDSKSRLNAALPAAAEAARQEFYAPKIQEFLDNNFEQAKAEAIKDNWNPFHAGDYYNDPKNVWTPERKKAYEDKYMSTDGKKLSTDAEAYVKANQLNKIPPEEAKRIMTGAYDYTSVPVLKDVIDKYPISVQRRILTAVAKRDKMLKNPTEIDEGGASYGASVPQQQAGADDDTYDIDPITGDMSSGQ